MLILDISGVIRAAGGTNAKDAEQEQDKRPVEHVSAWSMPWAD